MENIILILTVLVIVGLAAWYIIKEKKRGARCIGCPSAGKCSKGSCGGCGGNCSCR